MKMKLSEQIRADREKLKKLPDRNSRLRFIWDYYKYPLLFVSTVLVILLVSFISNIGKADINLYVVLLNNDSPIVECDESIFNDTMSRAGIDMNRKRVDVNKDLSLGMGTTEATDMETLQVLTALFSISDLDVYVAPKQYFDYFVQENGFADLNRLIDRDILDRYPDDLYGRTDANGNLYVDGIILHQGSPLHKAGYYHDDVVIGVVNNAYHFDEAIAFLKQLLRDRN